MSQSNNKDIYEFGLNQTNTVSSLFSLGINGAIYELTKKILEYTLYIYDIDKILLELNKAQYEVAKADYELSLKNTKDDEEFYTETLKVLKSIDNKLSRLEEKSN